jgi:hypothetical protein
MVNLAIDGKIISEWILGTLAGKVWTGLTWFWIGTNVGIL